MSLVKTYFFLMVNLYFQGMQKTKLDQTKVHGLYDHVVVFQDSKDPTNSTVHFGVKKFHPSKYLLRRCFRYIFLGGSKYVLSRCLDVWICIP